MSRDYPFLEPCGASLCLRLRLQPRASKNKAECMPDGTFKVWLTAPPVEGEANRALIDFIAGLLGLKRSALSIESGLKSRDKRLLITGASIEQVAATLDRLFPENKGLF